MHHFFYAAVTLGLNSRCALRCVESFAVLSVAAPVQR
jgi:hypothetical protein